MHRANPTYQDFSSFDVIRDIFSCDPRGWRRGNKRKSQLFSLLDIAVDFSHQVADSIPVRARCQTNVEHGTAAANKDARKGLGVIGLSPVGEPQITAPTFGC